MNRFKHSVSEQHRLCSDCIEVCVEVLPPSQPNGGHVERGTVLKYRLILSVLFTYYFLVGEALMGTQWNSLNPL